MKTLRNLRRSQYDAETSDVIMLAIAIFDRDGCTWGTAIARAEKIMAAKLLTA